MTRNRLKFFPAGLQSVTALVAVYNTKNATVRESMAAASNFPYCILGLTVIYY